MKRRSGPGLHQTVRRFSWGVVDQGVSSVSNFALGITVAHVLGARDFGAFSLIFLSYSLVLSAVRGVATDPLTVRFSTKPRAEQREAISAATATSICLGATVGAFCCLLGLLISGSFGTGFIVLGCSLPLLLLQDAWRFGFFCAGEPHKAVVNDLAWGLIQIGLLVLVGLGGLHDIAWCLMAFGISGAIAALLGLLQTGLVPRPSAVWGWLHSNRDLGMRYFVENLSISAAAQLRFVALGAVAGLISVGYVRGAEILMGPFLVMLMGLSQVAVPEAAHVVSESPHRLRRFCAGIGGAAALLAALWGLGVALLLPQAWGSKVLADVWPGAHALIVPVALGMVAGSFEIGAAAGLRAMGLAKASLSAQLTSSVLYLAGGTAGAYLGGAAGSCWGIVIAHTLAVFCWWWHLVRATQTQKLAPMRVTTGEAIV